jgi:hypothetical protein
MADAGIKKVIVQKKNLPSISGIDNKYIVRYRIVSDDKNRTSHWSPQYKIGAPVISTVNHSIVVDSAANVIRLVWDQVKDISGYDIYVKWDSGDWEYLGVSTTNTYSSLIKIGKLQVTFAVQTPTFPKNRFTASTLFQTVLTTL